MIHWIYTYLIMSAFFLGINIETIKKEFRDNIVDGLTIMLLHIIFVPIMVVIVFVDSLGKR